MDSRIIDVNFNKTFMKLVLDYDLPMTVATVKVSRLTHHTFRRLMAASQTVDKELGRSLAHLENYVKAKVLIEASTLIVSHSPTPYD